MNKRLKIVSIVGARPQFIKAAAVSRAIAKHNKTIPDCAIAEKIVHTGQHYDKNMSKVFFDELDIPRPDYNLEVGSGSHGEQTGKMLQAIETVLIEQEPNWCLVYGDTNSTLAGALAAAKLHTPVAHVEAGLRSFNRRMPEEINRVLTDHISDLLFCPTDTTVKNLASEGISEGVYRVGDVMYDSTLFYIKKSKRIEQKTLERLDIEPKSYYLATIHRAENTDDESRLNNIVCALNEIATKDCSVILPLHPRTVKSVNNYGLKFNGNVNVIQSVSYLQMLALENNARVILTDSGGVQKEAYFHHVPCVTLREETEWVETVESGWNVLTEAEKGAIVQAVTRVGQIERASWQPFYGQGQTAPSIVNCLLARAVEKGVVR